MSRRATPLTVPGTDRGVSDVLAFVIVFSIIVTSVALVYSVGFGGLSDLQEGEQKQNAERAFSAFSESLDEVEQGVAPRRSGQLSLRGGQLVITDDTTMTIAVVNATGGTETYGPLSVGGLQYRYEEMTVAYHGGGIFRTDRDAAVNVEPPSLRCDPENDVAVVTVVEVTSDEGAIGSDGSVQVTVVRKSTSILYPGTSHNASARQVSVTVSNSPYGDAWQRHLTDEGWTDSGGDTYVCDLDGDGDGGTIYVRTIHVEVSYTS